MNIIFTEMFNKECRDKFHIAETTVRQAITSPNEQSVIKLDDLELGFYTKHIVDTGGQHYLLVCARRDGGNLLVDLAFTILTELVDEVNTLEPVILLQQLALRFGLTIRVGQQLNRFILKESIPIELSSDPTKLIEVINPENHPFVQSMFIKIEQKADTKIAHCALAYCIDSGRYLAWLTGKETLQDVVIDIAPQLKGKVTPRDLIEASGTIVFWINYSQLGVGKGGYLFRVSADGYQMEVGFSESNFYIARNALKLELPFSPRANENVMCVAT